MNDSDTTIGEHLEEAIEGLRLNEDIWREDEVSTDAVPGILYSTARDYEQLAKSAVLLGATHQSRAWFGESARFYLKHIRAGRVRRDICDWTVWEGEPRMFSGAIYHALLSRDEELLTEVATGAVEMDECYLDAFADDYPDYTAIYYSVKVEAALILDDERASRLLEQFKTEMEQVGETSRYWEILPNYYQALIDGDTAAAETATEELVEYYAGENPEPDSPEKYVLSEACAYVVLAQRYGVEVAPESDRLPAALLREELPEDDAELDVDLTDLRVTSRVGFFEFERDEEGDPVIVGRIYHPGGELVSMEDIPEREAGRVLSEEWIEAAFAEADWQDRHDEVLVADAKAAFEAGTLRRKLVVVQDRIDEFTFDESVGDSPIDPVEFLKGASRLE